MPCRLNYFSSCSEILLTLLPITSIYPIYRRHLYTLQTLGEIGCGCSWKILPESAAVRSANLVPQHCTGSPACRQEHLTCLKLSDYWSLAADNVIIPGYFGFFLWSDRLSDELFTCWMISVDRENLAAVGKKIKKLPFLLQIIQEMNKIISAVYLCPYKCFCLWDLTLPRAWSL